MHCIVFNLFSGQKGTYGRTDGQTDWLTGGRTDGRTDESITEFHVDALHSFKVMLRTKFKNENEQRAITPKVRCLEWWFLCTALFFNDIYLPTCIKFHVETLHSFKVMLRTKFKNENEQRAITPNLWSFELWFLCSALLLNEINLPMKFHVDALHSFEVILRTKKGRTDGRAGGRTDGRTSQSLQYHQSKAYSLCTKLWEIVHCGAFYCPMVLLMVLSQFWSRLKAICSYFWISHKQFVYCALDSYLQLNH